MGAEPMEVHEQAPSSGECGESNQQQDDRYIPSRCDDGDGLDSESDADAALVPDPQPLVGGDALPPEDDEFLGEGPPLPEGGEDAFWHE